MCLTDGDWIRACVTIYAKGEKKKKGTVLMKKTKGDKDGEGFG